MTALLVRVGNDVLATFAATWPFLLLSVAAAAALTVYVGTERMGRWLRRRTGVAVGSAVGVATATPFCSCGTTAVALGMMATSAPWAPIVAFMVASPLTSPSELLLSAGLLGWPFALLFFGGTIVLGLGAGGVTHLAERAGWLTGQARMASSCSTSSCNTPTSSCDATDACSTSSCETPAQPVSRAPALSMGPGAAAITEIGPLWRRWRLDAFGREMVRSGRRMLLFFTGFTALGYLVIEAIPTSWLQSALGGDSPWAIVVAALAGVPMYLNTEGSLPLLAGLMDGGMGPGPAMAFLVTGAGTSLGAVTGMLVIARRRVVALTLGILLAGAVLLGLLAQVVLG
jgi:uncharacterized membrane protein YraQ (UPF0718 family)